MQPHKFPYKWYLKDGYPAKGIEPHHKTVFSTFSCGGGSTMGYKLAGYDVIAANDIDNQMRQVYIANHHPKYYVFGDIRKLLTMDFPQEFYNLDILDGSPPCSTFSMAGSREDAWGKAKQFREGQAMQTLDDLFFDFIALAKKLQPKVIIAENVKGLISGNAKGYFIEIVKQFEEAGYDVQSFLFNAATMGVPQARERVFILCSRKDLNLPKIEISFNEKEIALQDAFKGLEQQTKEQLTKQQEKYWNLCKDGESFAKYHPKGSLFGQSKVSRYKPCTTLNTKMDSKFHYEEKRYLTLKEWQLIGTFPLDYDFKDIQGKYLIGMSVPPVMTAQIAHQVYLQWLSRLT